MSWTGEDTNTCLFSFHLLKSIGGRTTGLNVMVPMAEVRNIRGF
jgi:hypothetical protein